MREKSEKFIKAGDNIHLQWYPVYAERDSFQHRTDHAGGWPGVRHSGMLMALCRMWRFCVLAISIWQPCGIAIVLVHSLFLFLFYLFTSLFSLTALIVV